MKVVQYIYLILVIETTTIFYIFPHFKNQRKKLMTRKWCNGPLTFQDPPGPVTALASFPGSGNTWTRYLIQQASGIATGSVYLDRSLQLSDFPGEGIFDGSLIAIKTHCAKEEPPKPEWPKKFDKVILLVRDPFDTFLAEFNRRRSESHTGIAPLEEFTGKRWFEFVEKVSREWQEFYEFYLNFYDPEKVHILTYESLKSDLIKTLNDLMDFLELPKINQETAKCIIAKKEGTKQRPKAEIDLKQFFTPQQKELVTRLKTKLYEKLKL